MMMQNCEDHARKGYTRESDPYRKVLRGCSHGELMPDDTAPFRKLGPVAWIMFAVLIALPVGMVLGAGAKHCDCTEVGPR